MVSLRIFLTLEVGMQMILRAFTLTKKNFLFYFQLYLPFLVLFFQKKLKMCSSIENEEK